MIEIKSLTEKSIDDITELDSRFGSSWSTELYKERLNLFSDLSYGSYLDNELIGFIIGKRISPEEVLISRIVVRKEKENNGVGKKLVEHFEKSISEVEVISAVTRKSNNRSINLYKSCGFTQDKNYRYRYKDEELGLKFMKEVNV